MKMSFCTALIGLSASIGLSACAGPAFAASQEFGQIERGRYLTIAGDCAACHTVPGSAQALAGGRPIETPFGNLLASNITPDLDTGIGAWSDEAFVNAMTKGIRPDGSNLYPAMPYTYYTKVTREDVLAIRAYLNTLPAVRNTVRANQLPFPFDVRTGMKAWNALHFSPGTFEPVAGKSDEWNRGAYLAEGLMHCGLCHTPKNSLGGDETKQKLQGYVLQGWFAPNITNDDRRGLGGWSVEEIVAYLKTGHNRTAAAAGPMAEEVARSSSKLTEADLRGIAIYLKDQPGQAHEAASLADGTTMKIGAAIYGDECSACHTPKGTGIAGLFPALSGSPAVQSVEPTSLIHVVLRGARSVATDGAPTGPAMPPFGWLLTDEQVAAVTTFVRQAWGNTASAVTAEEVGRARRELATRSD